MPIIPVVAPVKSTPTLAIPLMLPANGDLSGIAYILDALLQGGPKSATISAPPAGPSQGDLYIVATGATGAWAGQVGNLALCVPLVVKDGRPNPYSWEWNFITPKAGMNLTVQDTNKQWVYSGGVWSIQGVSFTAAVPANSSAAGIPGQIFADASAIYICTATNTWRKVATTTF